MASPSAPTTPTLSNLAPSGPAPSDPSAIRLRPHHLLCMLTFIGRGYTADFTANYRRIAASLSAGVAIEIVDGPDDICQPLVAGCAADGRDGTDGTDADDGAAAHCHGASVMARDATAAASVAALLGLPVAAGTVIRPDAALLALLRAAFAAGGIRPACAGCEWMDLCDRVVAADFAGALVGPV